MQDRVALLYSDLPIDMEPRAYSAEEFSTMVRQGEGFAIEALKVGIPLYGEKYVRELNEHPTK